MRSALDAVKVRMTWDVKVPMRDGIRLSGVLYTSAVSKEAHPAICTLTPYVAQSSHDAAVYFAAHGYPFLCVDVRGRGNSEGIFRANGDEARDGHDVVEWLARQPCCNGKVAMWGGSYSGAAQWAAAREIPAHLATIAPVASPFRGVDSPAPGNIFPPYRVQWLALLAGRTSQERIFADQAFWNAQFRRWYESGVPFKELDSLLGMPSPIFQEWMSHPEPDAFWDAHNPEPREYAQIPIPILTITGMYDGNQLGALTHYRQHLHHGSEEARAKHFLVIGPWDHAGTRTPVSEFGGLKVGPASLLDLRRLHLEWYAWTMQGGPKPAFLRRRVAYYVMGIDEWRYADSLDEITARSMPLFLGSSGNPNDVLKSGSLSSEAPLESEVDHYTYDPSDVSLAEIESGVDPASLVDQRMTYASAGRRLFYHTPPFERDTEISGFFRLTLWLSIDQPDTDFLIAIHEVDEDGGALRLAADLMRARYRESIRDQKLVTTSSPLRYEFERFPFVSRVVRKGHRLRLTVGPIDSIFWQKNYNSGKAVAEECMKDARPVTVKLFHDRSHASALHVPIGRSS